MSEVDRAPLLESNGDARGDAQPRSDKLTWQHGLVFFSAFMAFTFDFFEVELFAALAKSCVSDLLNLPATAPGFDSTIDYWSGIMSSALLVGWGCGGLLFGWLADVFGRSRIMLLTVATYCVGTALCAVAPSLYLLMFLRFFVGLGIGGEVGSGATLLAETFPPRWRVLFSSLLFSGASVGPYAASLVAVAFANPNPHSNTHSLADSRSGWRYGFLVGLAPAVLTLAMRCGIKESGAWVRATAATATATTVPAEQHVPASSAAAGAEADALSVSVVRVPVEPSSSAASAAPGASEPDAAAIHLARTRPCGTVLLLLTSYRSRTLCGIILCSVPLLTFWCFASFDFALVDRMAADAGAKPTEYESTLTLLGMAAGFAVIPPVALLGRTTRRLPALAFAFAAGAALLFGVLWPASIAPHTRLLLLFPLLTLVIAPFALMPVYLPELFPLSLRATGYGLCYNAGRFIASAAVFGVGEVRKQTSGTGSLSRVLACVAIVPALGFLYLALGFGTETVSQGRPAALDEERAEQRSAGNKEGEERKERKSAVHAEDVVSPAARFVSLQRVPDASPSSALARSHSQSQSPAVQ